LSKSLNWLNPLSQFNPPTYHMLCLSLKRGA
jgi:hypothetical protein